MERHVFAQRFLEASARARDFAREFIDEPLPDAMLFRLHLNASYDGNPLHADERVFPHDSDAELARKLSRCSSDEVVDVLWRDGMVPEWVNVSVVGELGTATLIEVLACGRFTTNELLLYHESEGLPPFHALGPAVPVGFEQGQKFSIYDRSECWNLDELKSTMGHAAKVWSLKLYGRDFDDETLASLPAYEQLHILELKDSPLAGPGLARLNAQQGLRRLRVDLGHDGPFTARHLPQLPALETLTIENLPAGSWDFATVATHTSGLGELSLASAHALELDAGLAGPLRGLTLRAPSVKGDPLPEVVVSLRLHLRDARDGAIEQLLARVKAVTHLSFRGTPVSEKLVESLVSRFKLEYLDVVDTGVSHECVRRIRARNPDLRTHPNPDVQLTTLEDDLE